MKNKTKEGLTAWNSEGGCDKDVARRQSDFIQSLRRVVPQGSLEGIGDFTVGGRIIK